MDSTDWDWGGGFCKLHRGSELPCQRCIENPPDGLLREDTVAAIIETWKAGGTYINPYSKREKDEAHRQWNVVEVIRDGQVIDRTTGINRIIDKDIEWSLRPFDWVSGPSVQNLPKAEFAKEVSSTIKGVFVSNDTPILEPVSRVIFEKPITVKNGETLRVSLVDRLQARRDEIAAKMIEGGVRDPNSLLTMIGADEVTDPNGGYFLAPKSPPAYIPSDYTLVASILSKTERDEEMEQTLIDEINRWGDEVYLLLIEKGVPEATIEKLRRAKSNPIDFG